ncbi:MAG: hypothetical protein WD048_00530 [Chitinophagales bacterium]
MNYKNIFSLISIILTAMIYSGCYYDNEEELYEEYYASQTCDTVAVSYDESIRPIIESSCNLSGCHIAGGDGNGIFTNYAGVKAKVDNGSMMNRVVDVRTMPPNTQLNSCQISLVKAWIDQGALNN